MIPSVFSPASDYLPVVERYREKWAEFGHDEADCRIGACSHAHVARDSQEAKARWELR